MKALVSILLIALYVYSATAFTVFDSESEEQLEKRLADKMENLEKLAEKFIKRKERKADEKEVRERRGCDSNPCEKGSCSEESQPLANIGIDYLCDCADGFGGYNCEIEDPCSSCPDGTAMCVPSNIKKDGKICYDDNFNVINE